jgi:hypothetical protein
MYHPDLGYVGDGPPGTEAEAKLFALRAGLLLPDDACCSRIRIWCTKNAHTHIHTPRLFQLTMNHMQIAQRVCPDGGSTHTYSQRPRWNRWLAGKPTPLHR